MMNISGRAVFLVWGGNGWIAGMLVELLQKGGHAVYATTTRMEAREAVTAELDRVNPTHVLDCAGVTGRPNVDWCEDNKEATIRSNVIGTLNLADCCSQRGIHCTIYATGCKVQKVKPNCPAPDGSVSDYERLTSDRSQPIMAIFCHQMMLERPQDFVKSVSCFSVLQRRQPYAGAEKLMLIGKIESALNPSYHAGIYTYDTAHPMYSGVGFTEADRPNFSGSFYSFTKAHTENLLDSAYKANTLILRLRMPVSDDLHPRSFVTKITRYERVVDIPNSNSILHDLLPCSIALALRKEAGIYNFTNPGAISHNEILALYERYVQPGFTWKNFSLQEQAKVIKADRSNCELDVQKLVNKVGQYGIDIPEIHQAYTQCFRRMSNNLTAGSVGTEDRNMFARAHNISAATPQEVADSDSYDRSDRKPSDEAN